MTHFIINSQRAALFAALLCGLSCSVEAADTACVPVATWGVPAAASAKPIAVTKLMPRAAKQSVVLLGESHDSADDHRWQLQTIAALYAQRPQMAIAFEAFPRRVQPVLDRWVAGEFTEAQFLKAVDWYRVWNFDPQLYLPLFNFARINRVPMIAISGQIERKREQTFTHQVVMDGGNTLYTDTARRIRNLEGSGILYVGSGVSGGEEGARFGRSLLGSAAFAGTHTITTDRGRTDKDGIRLEDAMRMLSK